MLVVMPSTAKVAMPAGRPDRRISGMPATSANSAPAAAAIASETAVEVVRVAQDAEHRRQDQVLLLDVEREDPGEVGADGDEADVPEREHAGVADEDVDRDHDRDADQRLAELELADRVQLRADRGDGDDEHHRAASAASASRRRASYALRRGRRAGWRTGRSGAAG